MSSAEIRPFRGLEDFEACVEVQERVWGKGFSERVPVAILKVAQRLGGIAAGAWAGEDEGLVGFVFGMTGLEDGEVIHWSDMLAVLPGHRDEGLGRRLKAYQRRVLLERGIHRVLWTFDPLESKNAHLNFARLGVVAREYQENMYGATDSPLHRAIGTDRFVATWLLDSERVRARLAGEGGPAGLEELDAVPVLEVRAEGEELAPGVPDTRRRDARLRVPVPARIQELRDRDQDLAARWRAATREALSSYLDRGWEAREVVRDPERPVSWYLLVRDEA